MRFITRSAVGLTVAVALAMPLAGVAPVQAAVGHPATVQPSHKHACTKTSSGKCIKGGEFCPKSKYHKSGWDAKGHRYVCKGNKNHPHWEKP